MGLSWAWLRRVAACFRFRPYLFSGTSGTSTGEKEEGSEETVRSRDQCITTSYCTAIRETSSRLLEGIVQDTSGTYSQSSQGADISSINGMTCWQDRPG